MRSEDNQPDFLGITTVGERGQVVIPKVARIALNLSTGDRLVVLPSKHGKGLLLMQEEEIKRLAQEMSEHANHISQKSKRLQQKLQDAEDLE